MRRLHDVEIWHHAEFWHHAAGPPSLSQVCGRISMLRRGRLASMLLLLVSGCCGGSDRDAAGLALQMHGVIVVTRHGDRSALHPVPTALTPGLNDAERSRWVGPPWGDLTTKGEEQHRRLGARCRCRYGALIGDRYDARKVYARSTASDRALRSGQAFLFGLFSETYACTDAAGSYSFPWTAATATEGGLRGTGGGDEIPEPASSSEPLSVWGGDAGRTAALHSVPKEQDTLLRAFDLCPVYQKLLSELHDGHEWKVKETLELQPGGTLAAWRDVVEAAGIRDDIEQTWSLWCFVPLFDSINVLLNHGFAYALPQALAKDDGALLNRASKLYHWCRTRKYGPAPQLGRVSGGMLLSAIRHRLVALAQAAEHGGVHEEGEEVEEVGLAADGGPSGAPLTPFTLYSAHDSTLMSLCAALGVPLDYNPPYASALSVELWRHRSTADVSTQLGLRTGGQSKSDKLRDVAKNLPGFYVALTMNGEPLSVRGIDCMARLSGSESDPAEAPSVPACLVSLDELLKHTEAIVPDEYDHSSWHAECDHAHTGVASERGSPGSGAPRPDDNRSTTETRGSKPGALLCLVAAIVVAIFLLRRRMLCVRFKASHCGNGAGNSKDSYL